MKTSRDIAELITADSEYPLSTDMIEDYIRNYASEKCKEQRRICSISFEDYDGENFGISHKVLNAPEPEL